MEKYKKEDLERLIIVEKKSYEAIGRLYGVSGAAIKRAAIRRNIPLPSRRKINSKEVFSNKQRTLTSLVYRVNDEEFKDIIASSSKWAVIAEKLGYKSRVLSENVKDDIRQRCSELNIEMHLEKKPLVEEVTKGEFFQRRKNWQSARSGIVKHARKVYLESGRPLKCCICGYEATVDIAHIKAVAAFDDNALIKEINNIENLIALCPNHHWEYDNGLLKIK